ncbi:MAG TPA: FAD-dependent oxidoreductase, partial [Anaerolineae bacterium]
MRKYFIAAVVVVAVSAYWIFDVHQYLSLEGIKAAQAQLDSWRSGSPFLAGLSFFALYIAVTSLSLPGAAVLTLAAGAFFGLLWGVVIVSFASTIGATLAFLVARFILRDSVQSRFGNRLQAINRGIEQEGAFYLFTLRLVPIVPFFIINLLMGLTPIRTWTFYWISQVGMLAGTIVYVNAGTQLVRIDSLSGILSPALMISFAVLGLFPLIGKKSVAWLKKRRVFAKWARPATFDRNLIVIGAGAAGLVSAYIGAAVKAKVTLVEANKMGGDCLNYGCVPSKALIKSAKLAHHIRHGDDYGLEAVEPNFSFRKVMARVHRVIATVEPHDSIERYTSLGVEVLSGYARLLDPWTVEVALNDGGTRRLTSRAIVIAAGARPFVPPLPGLDDVGYLTSDNLWDTFAALDEPPRRLVVLGGGPIGCELSQAFARLGSEVWQIEMVARILFREDEEVSEIAEASLAKDGVHVMTGHKALRCERDGEQKFIVVEHEGQELRIEFDALICAVGRIARLQGYGLEELGIPTERTVVTNEYL